MAVRDNSYGLAATQDKMLGALKYFIGICEKYDIRYWAGAGTCLGALRHKGFIPWDEDLDVFVPRPDYERLWEICTTKEIYPKYRLCRTTAEKNYRHRVMQMVDLETTFINERAKNDDIEHGVYIDIIPLDIFSKSKLRRLWQIYNGILYSVYNMQCKPVYYGNTLKNSLIGFMLWVVRDPKKRVAIWQRAEKRMTQKKWDETSDLIDMAGSINLKMLFSPMKRSWFGDRSRKAEFEDIEIVIPNGAEEYMTWMYGDYMQLPPEEKRCFKHKTVFVDLNNSYTKYRHIYYLTDDTSNT